MKSLQQKLKEVRISESANDDKSDMIEEIISAMSHAGSNEQKVMDLIYDVIDSSSTDTDEISDKLSKVGYSSIVTLFNKVSKLTESKLNEAGKWESENFDKGFYDFWASGDLLFSNLSHFMDDMNAGKTQDAVFSLKTAYEELEELKNHIKKYESKIKAELQKFNVNVK